MHIFAAFLVIARDLHGVATKISSISFDWFYDDISIGSFRLIFELQKLLVAMMQNDSYCRCIQKQMLFRLLISQLEFPCVQYWLVSVLCPIWWIRYKLWTLHLLFTSMNSVLLRITYGSRCDRWEELHPHKDLDDKLHHNAVSQRWFSCFFFYCGHNDTLYCNYEALMNQSAPQNKILSLQRQA